METRKAFLSPEELSTYLAIPVQTIYSWRKKDEGPPGRKFGRHVRYRLADVDQWVETR
jgi:excisionase family DNA binding protein